MPLKVEHYYLDNAKAAEALANALYKFRFSCRNFKRHDPRLRKHCVSCKFEYPYVYDDWSEDELERNRYILLDAALRLYCLAFSLLGLGLDGDTVG